jgi:YesN/AraC family two-component response regulator
VSEFHDIACGNGLKEKREKDSTKKIRRNNIRWREKDSEDSKTSTSENIREHSALPITCSEVSDTFPLSSAKISRYTEHVPPSARKAGRQSCSKV